MTKKLFIVGNWKSNKTSFEATKWLQESGIRNQESGRNKKIIVCPSFTLLSDLKSYITDHKLPLKLGAQDISPFDEGAYTGEVNGKQLKEFCDYVIIGHSERRDNFHEDDDLLTKKVEMAKKYNLEPIFCVQNDQTNVPQGVSIVAYEPVFAIGSGNPDTPENANNVATIIKSKIGVEHVFYGGSVTSKNVFDFTKMSQLDGVLVGGASLDPSEFSRIVQLV